MPDRRWNVGGRIPIETVLKHKPHAGLWLDKYLAAQPRRGESGTEQQRQSLVDEVTQIEISPIYAEFFHQWQQALTAAQAKTRRARLLGCRLCVGLGGESVLETAITLHRTYGVPYIPGSALKGLAAHYARQRLGVAWQPQGDAYKILFGYAEQKEASAGYVTFYDALYIPESGPNPLQPDVLTVHHPDYYNQPGSQAAPADWDSPTIIPLISATGDYLVALSGPGIWVEAGLKILNMALVELGVGAKTSSGYGRMRLDDVPLPDELQRFVGQSTAKPVESYAAAKKRLLDEAPAAGRERGTVIKLPKPQYGFIRRKNGAELFIHQKQLRQTGTMLREGQIVEYQIGPGQEAGKAQANDVVILLEPSA